MSDQPTPVVLGSRAVRVTFFEDRAEVVRQAAVTVPDGTGWVVVGGLSPFVDDRSLQARVAAGPGDILAARVRRVVHVEPVLGREEIAALEQESRDAVLQEGAARAASARARAAQDRAAAGLQDWMAAVSSVPPGEARSWEAAWRRLDEAAADARREAASAADAVALAADRRARAEARLAEGLRTLPRVEAHAEVQIAGDAGGATVEVTYRTPMAVWRPEHVAALDDEGHVAITTLATVWQRTGEVWDGVEASFSTARPAREATPPLLADDVLRARRKSEEERRTVVVEARDQEILLAGAEGVRVIDEMPGVDDGGQALVYRAPGPVSITSDGRPFRVEIATTEVAATVDLVAMPELAPAAHLRARATLTGTGPLLAGPVHLRRETSVVGRSRIGFVAPGEPLELGFGADDAVRVRRQVDTEEDKAALTGTQKWRRTVRLYLSNLSGDTRRVTVIERVPVSEIEEVEVKVVDGTGWDTDRDGFARRHIDLTPHASAAITLGYEVKAGSKVRLSL